MKRCLWGCWAFAIALLGGCGVLDAFFLPRPDGTPSTSQGAEGVVGNIPGGYGTLIAGGLWLLRHGYVEIRHFQLIRAGKKDDNKNGVDDALETRPPAPPTSPAA